MKNELLLTKLYLHAFENLNCNYRITSYKLHPKIERFFKTSIAFDRITKVLKNLSKPVSVDPTITRNYLMKPNPINIYIGTSRPGKCRMFVQYSENLFERNGSWYYGEIVESNYFCNEKYLKIKKSLLTKKSVGKKGK